MTVTKFSPPDLYTLPVYCLVLRNVHGKAGQMILRNTFISRKLADTCRSRLSLERSVNKYLHSSLKSTGWARRPLGLRWLEKAKNIASKVQKSPSCSRLSWAGLGWLPHPLQLLSNLVFWMVWFGLDKYQVPTKTALSLPLLSRTGEMKYDERLEGRDKDRERSLTNYCHGQNRLNLGRKGSLFHHQSNQNRIMRTKTRS